MTRFQSTAALLAVLCSSSAFGQNLAALQTLPNAPIATVQAAAPPSQDTAKLSGIVLDGQDNPVSHASVALTAPGKAGQRDATSDDTGAFSFTALPPGKYRLIVTAPGLAPFTSPEFSIRAGEDATAPKIALGISTSSSVTVFASPDQIAVAQVHEQEQQRVLGVFPNFYTSYIWNAQPMPANQKFKLALRSFVDPVQFLTVGGTAAAEQYNNTFPGYGPGIEGYGKRYGATLADVATSRLFGAAILPVLLHQDPRYFYQGSGGAGSRTLHAVASVFVTRGDNGRTQPNYSSILGSLIAGSVANAYHPDTSRGASVTFQTFGISIGGGIAGNLIREFVLRGFVPNVPAFANGKP